MGKFQNYFQENLRYSPTRPDAVRYNKMLMFSISTFISTSSACRRKVFEANLRKIREHNYEADLGKHRYQVGINEYSDLTLPEYRKILLGYRKPKKNQSQASSSSTFMRPASIKLPKKVDWRKHGYVTDIKNQVRKKFLFVDICMYPHVSHFQGNCGSCWAFSTTGSLEGQYFRKTGKLVPLSEQQLVDCSGGFSNQGCEGGLMDQAFEYIKLRGIESEKSYPYIAIVSRIGNFLKNINRQLCR